MISLEDCLGRSSLREYSGRVAPTSPVYSSGDSLYQESNDYDDGNYNSKAKKGQDYSLGSSLDVVA